MDGPEMMIGGLLMESKLSFDTRTMFLRVLSRLPGQGGRSFERPKARERVEGSDEKSRGILPVSCLSARGGGARPICSCLG